MKKRINLKIVLQICIVIICGMAACYFTGTWVSTNDYCENRSGKYYYKYNRNYNNEKGVYLFNWTIGKPNNKKENILYITDIDKIYTSTQNVEREKMIVNVIRLNEYEDRISQMNTYKTILVLLTGIFVIYLLKFLDCKKRKESYYDGYAYGTSKVALVSCFISICILLYIIDLNKIHLDGIFDIIYLIK